VLEAKMLRLLRLLLVFLQQPLVLQHLLLPYLVRKDGVIGLKPSSSWLLLTEVLLLLFQIIVGSLILIGCVAE
jgi:hypothetical protein